MFDLLWRSAFRWKLSHLRLRRPPRRRPTLCGDRPDQDLLMRTYLRFDRILATTIGVREGHSEFGAVLPYLS